MLITDDFVNAPAEKERMDLCNQALKRIGKAWDEVGQARQPDMLTDAGLDAAKAKLEATWLAAQRELATLDEFKAALKAWEDENEKAIKAVK